VLLSTHILPEVEAICDRAIVIASGKIAAQGTPEELRQSRRMQARVLVECKGPAREVEAALSRVSGVAKVEPVDGANADRHFVSFAIRPREGQDVREEVASTVIRHGWPLREVRLEHATLEEFFVQVTAQQAVAQSE
jgi:ABC-2 type transport system ATP-binding protein